MSRSSTRSRTVLPANAVLVNMSGWYRESHHRTPGGVDTWLLGAPLPALPRNFIAVGDSDSDP